MVQNILGGSIPGGTVMAMVMKCASDEETGEEEYVSLLLEVYY